MRKFGAFSAVAAAAAVMARAAFAATPHATVKAQRLDRRDPEGQATGPTCACPGELPTS